MGFEGDAELDLVVRGGLIVDGTGSPGVLGDVGVVGGRIVAVGAVEGQGREEVDAGGCVVAPGFVDGHTHMDAQVFWDELSRSSCWHGVTTVAMGNCGFTLAPTRPGEEALVVRNLERAEDIAAEAMAEGIDWTWSTFADYLDAVDARPKALNHVASVGHSALRTWAMGERAFEQTATDDDLATMHAGLRDALRAGAAGFTTSRSGAHATSDNRPVASRLASWGEVLSLVDIVANESNAIFQLAPERSRDPALHDDYLERLRDLAVSSGVPIAFGYYASDDLPQPSLEHLEETAALGGDIRLLSHSRQSLGAAQSFRTNLAFDCLPEWQEVRHRPLAEQAVLLRDPDVRARLVHAAHHGHYDPAFGVEALRPRFNRLEVVLSAYLPNPMVSDEARRRGVDPVEAMIDIALETDFDALFFTSFTRQDDDERLLALLRHPLAAMCFSDSGAHVSQIFDSSIYSHLLAYWVREREALTVEEAVHMMTAKPAAVWRLADRGRLAEGYAADITIFDPATVAPLLPTVEADLPGAAQRLDQRATGFVATVVNGEIVMRDGVPTEARPGRLLRAAR
jgi:N-acyl-D-aspartate/D-glutamate deacylase